jgi:hypothetical protein
MFWRIAEIKRSEAIHDTEENTGRFVLHKHRDGEGDHHDLRLENGNCLVGWRIAGPALETGCWATEKMPHPTAWLEEDRDAVREKNGVYAWRFQDADHRRIALMGTDETIEVTLERCAEPSTDAVRALAGMAQKHHLSMAALPELIADGLAARSRSVERFCGLSRALDGESFDETGWRRLLDGMTLHEIGERLAKVEMRHDRIHPPAPLSRPEQLESDAQAGAVRRADAFRIAAE